jgi:hypothetical protein
MDVYVTYKFSLCVSQCSNNDYFLMWHSNVSSLREDLMTEMRRNLCSIKNNTDTLPYNNKNAIKTKTNITVNIQRYSTQMPVCYVHET